MSSKYLALFSDLRFPGVGKQSVKEDEKQKAEEEDPEMSYISTASNEERSKFKVVESPVVMVQSMQNR